MGSKKMKQQTAVEWFASELSGHLGPANVPELMAIFDRAKEMEKNQIENAFHSGVLDGDRKSIRKITTSEEYYEETYMDGADD